MLRSIYFLAGIVLGVALGRAASNEQTEAPAKPKQPVAPSSVRQEKASAPAEPAAKAKEPVAEESDSEPDDLTLIDGIGPAFAEDLQRIGIHRFSQLAEQDPDTLAETLNVRVTAERIRRDKWLEQAKALAQKG